MTISGISGTIAVGDVVQGDTSGTVAVATRAAWSNGAVFFRYLNAGDVFTSGESLTNTSQTGSATMTGGTERQERFPTITLSVIEDGVRRIMIGCRGKFTLSANQGEPMLVSMEFAGRLAVTPELDGIAVPGVVQNTLVPPAFLGISLTTGLDADLAADEVTARVTTMSLDFNNTVSVGRAATEASGLIGAAEIRSREVTGSFDPTVRAEAEFPWLANVRAGTPFRTNIQIGATAGSIFVMQEPACVPTQESTGDREGEAVREISYACSGRYPDGGEGVDREFLLVLR